MKFVVNGVIYADFKEFLMKNRKKPELSKEELMKNEVVRYFSQYWPDWKK